MSFIFCKYKEILEFIERNAAKNAAQKQGGSINVKERPKIPERRSLLSVVGSTSNRAVEKQPKEF